MPSPSLISPQQLIVVPQKKLQHQITPSCKNTKKLVLWKNVGLTNAREGTREKCRHLGKWKWKQSTCGGHIGVISMLPCGWLIFIVLMPSLACCQHLLDCFFHPAPPASTGLFDFNFSPPCASGSINNINNLWTPSTATPSSGLFYFNFFHPCKVGGSTTMEVAVQCHMTKCWQNCMHLAEGGEWSNNLPCHAYLLGRWWHDTKHSPLNDTKQHMQHLCSTWLIVSSSHFQKLPDKNYFFIWPKNSGTSSGIAQNALNALNALNGLIWREKNSPGNQKNHYCENPKRNSIT